MIGIAATALIWASLSVIGGASAENCYKNLELRLKSEASNTGWNNVGRGFLGIFTPAAMTDEHWQILGKIYKTKEFGLVKDFAMTMGGLIFLAVVGVLFILVFCAAPIALGVFTCTCKKKCKPKSNAIIMWSGIGCNSVAILTISLSLLFCFLSIKSLTGGIIGVGNNVENLPKLITGQIGIFKENVKGCGLSDFLSSLQSSVKEIPSKISSKITEIPDLKAVMEIDFKAKQDKIEELIKDAKEIDTQLGAAHTKLKGFEHLDPTNQLTPVLNDLTTAQQEIKNVLDDLDTNPDSVKKKLDKVVEDRKKADTVEIENKISLQMEPLSIKIKELAGQVDKQIEGAFEKVAEINKELDPVIKDLKKYTGYVEQYAGYMTALNLVLFPCYLALASAVLSTCQATKFVQKKKAKPKDKCTILIPIAIGLGLAFLPLLISTLFMSLAGVSNVVCNTVFKDESFAFLPKVLNIFDVKPVKFNGIEIDIPSILTECKSQKSLISILKMDSLVKEDLITDKFNVDAQKADITTKVQSMDFGLPPLESWGDIKTAVANVKIKRNNADTKMNALKAVLDTIIPIPGDPKKVKGLAPEIGEADILFTKFLANVDKFVTDCEEDIGKGEALTEAPLKAAILKEVGDSTNKGLLDEMFTSVNTRYLAMRKGLLEESTNCLFIFDLFESVGNLVCQQATGGLHGAYAAIGLGALSFISASIGTVMIWHSLRAGKGQDAAQKTPGSSDSKKGKKKKAKKEGEGEGGEGDEGGEEEEVEAVEPAPKEPFDWKGKIGEQATPIGPGGAPGLPMAGAPQPVPAPLVQAVPTDPSAGSDTKTNPSLLPNDAATPAAAAAPDAAGAQPESGPAPPNPIQMVNMEANNNNQDQKSDKQNSLTGAGGGETGPAPGTSQ